MNEDVFAALADPTRRRLLELLAGTEEPVSAVTAALQAHHPISQPAVSQHLKVLLAAGLVSVRAEGTRRFYALDPRGLEPARQWLARLADPLQAFAGPLDALATEVARGRGARRTGTPSASQEHGREHGREQGRERAQDAG